MHVRTNTHTYTYTHVSTEGISHISKNKKVSRCTMQLSYTHTGGRCYNLELWLCSYHWGNPAEPSISVQHKQNNIYKGLQTSVKTPWCKHIQRHMLLVKKNPREKKKNHKFVSFYCQVILHLRVARTHPFGLQCFLQGLWSTRAPLG